MITEISTVIFFFPFLTFFLVGCGGKKKRAQAPSVKPKPSSIKNESSPVKPETPPAKPADDEKKKEEEEAAKKKEQEEAAKKKKEEDEKKAAEEEEKKKKEEEEKKKKEEEEEKKKKEEDEKKVKEKEEETKKKEEEEKKKKEEEEEKKRKEEEEKKKKEEEEKKPEDEKKKEDEDKKNETPQGNTPKAAHLTVSPTGELLFKADCTAQTRVTLKNVHDKKIMFKIKFSDNAYQANPVFGTIEPGKSADVVVTHVKSPVKEGKMVIVNSNFVGDADLAKSFKSVRPTGGQITVKLVAK